ncbi:Glyoxylase, beta-lactamase superfamily II [Geosporobacter subterraneus DSM 17957]|uniref:Glyoxylase, beta-lactamase superfamily II n=1 Tax=Geosporobacter subterraneus DSM 17957 TaxID=1121919 RepID=A0A1M6I9N0_9FIRM|nr:MBL fold metallo-hydrolase [Geosporobacter subterraneus]SHJ31068.1 Glyoxylase, beta-lactamase superfamily II [Geosporobacter subterraneus DSM 17957]
MKVQKVKNRGLLFTYSNDWDLNLYLIRGNRYNYIIDTGLGPLNVAPIKENIKDDKKQLIIINTHFHWDHIWGNSAFDNSVIISHKLCREMIASNWEQMLQKNGRYAQGEFQMRLPEVVFEGELYFPEDKIRLIYTPGHTIDSISVLDEEEKVLNAGDNIGDTMEELVPSVYTDKQTYLETLYRYNDLDFDTCVSGHNVILEKKVIDKIIEEVLTSM